MTTIVPGVDGAVTTMVATPLLFDETRFADLVRMMVDADRAALTRS